MQIAVGCGDGAVRLFSLAPRLTLRATLPTGDRPMCLALHRATASILTSASAAERERERGWRRRRTQEPGTGRDRREGPKPSPLPYGGPPQVHCGVCGGERVCVCVCVSV